MATTKKKAVKKKTATKKKAETSQESSASGVDLADIIQNWNKMNEKLNTLSEEQCLELIGLEQQGRRRVHMLNRIHARYTKLRSERERVAIMSGESISA